jgi:hypothetical protein
MRRQDTLFGRRTALKTIGGCVAGALTVGVSTAQTTISVPGDYATIQAAINAASDGDAIDIDPGTYTEQLTVDTSVTLAGAGSGTDATANSILEGSGGNGLDMQADDITVQGFRVTGYSNGIRFGQNVSGTTLRNLVVTDNAPRGIEVRNPAELSDLTLEDVSLTDQEDGFRVSTDGAIDGLTIVDSAFDDNGIGLEVYTADTDPSSGNLTDVTIENTTFNDNSRKGIYTETLSDAELTDITVEDSGTNSTYGFNAGIDINLKYGDYQDITISGATVSGVTEGDPPNDRFPVGITIKARQDGGTYGANPATLQNVHLEDLTVDDNPNGIRFGEPGKDDYGLEDATVEQSDVENNEHFGLINETLVEVDATDVWWGHASGPGGPDGRHNPAGREIGKGDDIVGDVLFDPWLRRPADHPSR